MVAKTLACPIIVFAMVVVYGALSTRALAVNAVDGVLARSEQPAQSPFNIQPLAPHVMNHISQRLRTTMWPAYWIGIPNESQDEDMVRCYRKKITLDSATLGDEFWIHVSADERYKLYVNGQLVSAGPSRGDMCNWKFETLNLRPYLHEGDNAICAVVWYFTYGKPVAQMTYGECGFLMQGDTEREDIVNTNSSWRCIRNKAYSTSNAGRVRGYYAAGPREDVNLAEMPTGWLDAAYDDGSWKIAFGQFRAAMKGGTVDYPFRQLVERPIPQMERRECDPLKVRRFKSATDSFEVSPIDAKIWSPTTIAANSKVKILLDQRELTTGYLNVALSGGKGSTVTIGYAETLFSKDSNGEFRPLGSRDSIAQKEFLGYQDRVRCDGRKDYVFTPLWWRTWRYVQLEIETKDEPLEIGEIRGETSMYPFERASTLDAPENPTLQKILDIGWRTARLCANETYMDCPYYEQLQYFGDTRIQTMVSMYNTRDTLMVRQAIDMGKQALLAEGLLQSRYPSSVLQIISSYSLSWIGMVYDYWMYRDDPKFVSQMLPTVRHILAWYEQYINEDGSIGATPYWFFCDWASNFNYGRPFRQDDGHSAYQDLAVLKSLEEAAAMEEQLGIPGMAEHFHLLARKLRSNFVANYWDEERQLFADTKDRRNYSQHTNIMAILCDILPKEESRKLCEKMLEDKSITQVTIYFRYYLFAALKKTDLSDKLLDEMGVFYNQVKDDMTTWAEMPEPTRSDCHAWGASPNVELFRMLLGISSAAPGFNKIEIKPALGNLKKVSGSIPHPKGTISVNFELQKNGKLKKTVLLPQGVECDFVWDGKVEKLQ